MNTTELLEEEGDLHVLIWEDKVLNENSRLQNI